MCHADVLYPIRHFFFLFPFTLKIFLCRLHSVTNAQLLILSYLHVMSLCKEKKRHQLHIKFKQENICAEGKKYRF